MPRLSRWAVRSALLYLACGISIGALLLSFRALPLPPQIWLLLPVHLEFLLTGWTAQLALGIAFWILPRHTQGRPRGDERLAWLAYGLLNAGILLVGLSSIPSWPSGLAFAGRISQTGAVGAFAVHAWSRIRPTRD
jgi:hypothetical protein